MMNVGLRIYPYVSIAESGIGAGVSAAGQIVWGVCQLVLQVASFPQLLYVSKAPHWTPEIDPE